MFIRSKIVGACYVLLLPCCTLTIMVRSIYTDAQLYYYDNNLKIKKIIEMLVGLVISQIDT